MFRKPKPKNIRQRPLEIEGADEEDLASHQLDSAEKQHQRIVDVEDVIVSNQAKTVLSFAHEEEEDAAEFKLRRRKSLYSTAAHERLSTSSSRKHKIQKRDCIEIKEEIIRSTSQIPEKVLLI